MTRKELYRLSVEISGGVLRKFFGTPNQNFTDMECSAARKAARKHVYDTLVPLLVTDEIKTK